MSVFAEGLVQVGAARVRWRKAGQGPVLVFVHGFPVSGETWDAVIARLAPRFTCVTLDQIGLGGSSSTDAGDYSSQGQARAFRAVLSALGVSSYGLIGNDSGGWAARELALIDGARVSKMMLTNTEIPGHRPPWIPTYQRLAHMPGTGAVLSLLLRSRFYRRSPMGFGGVFHDLSLLDDDFHARFVVPLMTSPARIAGAMQFLREMKFSRLDEFASLHGELKMPVMFLWGADDPTFPLARARAMAAQFPNFARFAEIANAKLFFHEEYPLETAAHIARFFG